MTQLLREAVGIFDNIENLDRAVAELEGTDFPRHDISVLGDKQKIEERFGKEAVRPEWLEDNANAPRGISIRPEEKTIGASFLIGVPAYVCGCIALLAVNPAPGIVLLMAIALGSLTGAALGSLALFLISQNLKKTIEKQIRRGGLLLWVKTPGPRHEETAVHILRKHNGRHVHTHTIS